MTLLIKIEGLKVAVATVNREVMEYSINMNNFLPIKWECCSEQSELEKLRNENVRLKTIINRAYTEYTGIFK